MRLSDGDIRAITFYSAIAVGIALIMVLSGCGKKPPTSPVIVSGPSGTAYELPVGQASEDNLPTDPGKDAEDVVAVIVIPPSSTATTVRVYDKPKKIIKKAREIITGTKGSPDVAVVSDNPGVTVTSDKRTGLWPYLAGIAGIIAGIIAARKWFKRFGWVMKVIGWVKKIIGL